MNKPPRWPTSLPTLPGTPTRPLAAGQRPNDAFWSDDVLLVRMQRAWDGGMSEGTPCGNGSLMRNTELIRHWLPQMVAKYDIRSVCDAGAGDLHWQRHLRWDVDYMPFDLVPRRQNVVQCDITKEQLPLCDAILCRHVLIHFDAPRIFIALDGFRERARYLFASQYEGAAWRPFQQLNQWNPTDLRPLLGPYIECCPDADANGQVLALWDLDKAPFKRKPAFGPDLQPENV